MIVVLVVTEEDGDFIVTLEPSIQSRTDSKCTVCERFLWQKWPRLLNIRRLNKNDVLGGSPLGRRIKQIVEDNWGFLCLNSECTLEELITIHESPELRGFKTVRR